MAKMIWRQSILGLALGTVLAFATVSAQAGLRDDLAEWQGEHGPVGSCVVAWPECRHLAMQGDPRAQYLVGYAYYMGYYERNGGSAVAVKWLEQAAHQRLPLAMVQLGRMYRDGNGTERDITRAAMWFGLARTLAVSEDTLWNARYEFDSIKLQMSDAQMSESDRLVRDWLLRNPEGAMPPVPAVRPKR
jgi:hypothetical protein